MTDVLEPLRDDPARSGLFLDFDGTLAEIVERPELATPFPGAGAEVLRLAGIYALVAVVSGRPAEQVRGLLGTAGVEVVGLYGLEDGSPSPSWPTELRARVEAVAGAVPGAWVEDKGRSLAIHFRQAPDPEGARADLAPALGGLAEEAGLRLIEGKKVLELVPTGLPGKGEVVRSMVRERGLGRCLYAGDDVADLEAFRALDELGRAGTATVKVAVRTTETPLELIEAADVIVDGPAGLLFLLQSL